MRGMTVAAPEWHGYEQSAHRYRFPRMQERHERSDRVPADVCSSSGAIASPLGAGTIAQRRKL